MIHYDKGWPDDENFKSHKFESSLFKKYCNKCSIIILSLNYGNDLVYWIESARYVNKPIPNCRQVILERIMHEALE